MAIDIVLLIGLTIAALGAVMKRDTVKAAIALALSSIIVAILLFRFMSPLAAVFELSVCAGLITVIFMSTISLTKPQARAEEQERLDARVRDLAVLPVLVVVVGSLLAYIGIPMSFTVPAAAPAADVRNVMWNDRQIDLVGQVLVLLAGFMGVLVLFKQRLRAKRKPDVAQLRAPLPQPAISQAALNEVNSKLQQQQVTEPVLRD